MLISQPTTKHLQRKADRSEIFSPRSSSTATCVLFVSTQSSSWKDTKSKFTERLKFHINVHDAFSHVTIMHISGELLVRIILITITLFVAIFSTNLRVVHWLSPRRHILVHTDVKPFGCTFCSYASAYKHNLKTHIKNMHGEYLIKCPHCFEKFITRDEVDKHVRYHHFITKAWRWRTVCLPKTHFQAWSQNTEVNITLRSTSIRISSVNQCK